MQFVNYSNFEAPRTGTESRVQLVKALLEHETKNRSKVEKLLEGLGNQIEFSKAVSLFTDKLKAASILTIAGISEGDKKLGPDPYMTGLYDETKKDKEEQMKKQAKMDDDDPNAYKEMPGSEEAREKGKVKTSKHTKNYHELYGEEANESKLTWDSLIEKINESDLNDPVLVAFRAAKAKRQEELAKPKRRPLYGKEREKSEDQLWQISQDLKDLYSDRGQMLIDMEQEAEVEGGPIADKYGADLDKIELEIQKLIAKRGQLELRLAESFITEAEVDLWLEIEPEFIGMYSKLNDLAEETTDSKWKKAIEGIISSLDNLESKIGKASSKLGIVPTYEGVMSEIDIIAKEAKNFKEFVKAFKTDGRYKGLDDAGDTEEFEAWLQSVYDNAKMDESVITEGKTSAVYTDPNTGKKYDLQYVSTKKRWELDIMKKGASIYSSAITTIKRDTLAEIQEWLDGYNIDSSWTKGLSESVVTESHFKVGDKVKMSHGGEGVIKSLDKKDGDDDKYYSVELPTGEIHKHSPNELELIESVVLDGGWVDTKRLDSVDHTRLIKWIYKELDNDAKVTKSGGGYSIDTSNLDKEDIQYLIDYLKSQGYLQENFNESTTLFEKRVDVDQLIDVLANLEDAFTEEEFVEFGEDINVNSKTMTKIWNTYWDLNPRERLHFTTDDWSEWLNNNYGIKESVEINESATETLADEVSGELYKATLSGNSATFKATTTTKTWSDGVPVLKELARGKSKPVTFDKKVFNVVHDVAHGWFYFTDGRKWYGLHQEDGYNDPSDLPFSVELVESVATNEASINKIQKDWAKVTADMKTTVDAWKASEGKEKEKMLAKLKDLTAQKKKLEADLEDAVGLKDADAELVGEAEDYSDQMSYGQLERCVDYSTMIRERIQTGTSLDPWMHSQIAVAKNELNSVWDAIDGDDGEVEGETVESFIVEGVQYATYNAEKGVSHRYRILSDEIDVVKAFMISGYRYGYSFRDEVGFESASDRNQFIKILNKMYKQGLTKPKQSTTESVDGVNEAKVERIEMMAWIEKTLDFVRTTEEFDGSNGGIWVSGENLDEYKGKRIYHYYSNDSKKYTFGVLNSWEKELNKRGWYNEWYDAGTVMIWPL